MDWLRARGLATPDKPFLHIDGAAYSYAEIDGRVDALCAWLARAGVQPGEIVALLLPNGLNFALAALALMRLRAVMAPLNLRLTSDELNWQTEHIGAALLLHDAETRGQAKALDCRRLELPDCPPDAPPVPAPAHDLSADCAIIHTSGTSGRPKAAVLTYGNFRHSARASALRLGALPRDRWLCVLPLYHVGGLSILLRALIYGTALDLLSFSLAGVNQALTNLPITQVSLAPSMLGWLLDARQQAWNPRLRSILLGGEAARLDLLGRCAALDLPIAVSYGLSEACSQVATATAELVRRKPGTVGKPLAGARVRVVDESGADLATGQAGELLVQGATVMRGYHGQAPLADGWLRTGDIGYMDADGELFVLQRRVDLIVSGGENVYPAEVEAALREHPAVAEALVFGLPDARWGQRVAALIELKPGAAADADRLQTFARERLAGYKIPRQIAFGEIPRSAAGKIRRSAARRAFDDATPRR